MKINLQSINTIKGMRYIAFYQDYQRLYLCKDVKRRYLSIYKDKAEKFINEKSALEAIKKLV